MRRGGRRRDVRPPTWDQLREFAAVGLAACYDDGSWSLRPAVDLHALVDAADAAEATP